MILFSGLVSTVVADSPYKIFIGGLPNYLNDDQVRIFTLLITGEREREIFSFILGERIIDEFWSFESL